MNTSVSSATTQTDFPVEFTARMLRNATLLNVYINYSEQFGINFKINSKSHISLHSDKLNFLVGISKNN